MNSHKKALISKGTRITFLVIGAIIFLFPLYLVYINSLKPVGDIIAKTLNFPESLNFDSYLYVFKRTKYMRALFNTVFICVVGITLLVFASSMCAYKLSRINDKKSKFILMLFLSSMIIPFQTIMIPLVKVLNFLNINDSILGYILVMVPLFSPVAVFLYYNLLKTVPTTLDEAARIDGANDFQIFFKVIFPILKPVTATVIVLATLWVWNDFALPLIILESSEKKTITLVIAGFFGAFSQRWDYALAALALGSVPMIILYLFMQKHIIRGVTSGSVK